MPTNIYVSPTGDDETGDGSSGAPYASAQTAFQVAYDAGSGDYDIHLAAGTYGGISTNDWPSRIKIYGAGKTQSTLSYVGSNGQAGALNITSDKTVNLGNVYLLSGGSVANLGDTAITLNGCVANNITVDSADAASNGRYGGGVSLTDCECGSVNTNPQGNSATPAGYVSLTDSTCSGSIMARGEWNGGRGGNVTLLRSTVSGTITTDSDNTFNVWVTIQSAGDATLTDSTCGDISSNGGFGFGQSFIITGAGGTISLTTSTCGNITALGGPGNGDPNISQGSDGSVTLTGTCTVGIVQVGNGSLTKGSNTVSGRWGGTSYVSNVAAPLDFNGYGVWNNNYYKTFVLAFAVPSTIYVRTTGSNSSGDGTSGSPLRYAQLAFDIALGATGNRMLDFGAGNFGGVNLVSDWPSRISVRGAGATQSFLGGINGDGADQVWDWEYNVEISPCFNGFNVNVASNNTVNLGAISTVGGSAGYDYVNGMNGGEVTLTDAKFDTITTVGGNVVWQASSGSGGAVTLSGSYGNNIATGSGAGDQSSGMSTTGNGGAVTITDSTCGEIDSRALGLPGYPGACGNVSLTRSTCGNILAYGGGSISIGYGGTGGTVTLVSSTSGDITTTGGEGTVVAGTPGNVTLTDSVAGDIESIGGAENYGYGPGSNGATVSLTRSTCETIDASGGSVVTYYGDQTGGDGGSVTLTDSVCTSISSAAGVSMVGYAYGGVVTLSGNTIMPNVIEAKTVIMTNLKKGRGVNGSSIIGLV